MQTKTALCRPPFSRYSPSLRAQSTESRGCSEVLCLGGRQVVGEHVSHCATAVCPVSMMVVVVVPLARGRDGRCDAGKGGCGGVARRVLRRGHDAATPPCRCASVQCGRSRW